jgi:hypothetical protein
MSTVPTPSASTSAAGWHFARGQRRGGPVPFEQLQRWASAGKLLPGDRVLQPGSQQWQAADTIPGLFGTPNGIQTRPSPAPAPNGIKAVLPVAAVVAPMAPASLPTPETSSSPGINNRFLVLALVGAGALLFAFVGLALVVICLAGDFGRKSESAANEDPPEVKNSPRPNPKTKTPTLTPRQKQIMGSVDRGVSYLRNAMAQGGNFYAVGDPQSSAHPGAMALVGLTLLECGADPSDGDVQKAAAEVRRRAVDLRFTYSIAASVLFLDRLNADKVNPQDRELIRSLALRLIAGQTSKAGWDYYCQVRNQGDDQRLLERLQNGQYKAGDSFVNVTGRDYYDNSIGQFVTLALWVARKHNVPVRLPLLATEQRYRSQQNKNDGSWTYNDQNRFMRDTSTCAALIGLAVGRAVMDDKEGGGADLLQDEAVRKGLAHLAKIVGTKNRLSREEFDRRQKRTTDMEALMRQMEAARDPGEIQRLRTQLMALDNARELQGIIFGGDTWGDLYFLWSLERMAVIYDLKTIGDVDWHEWGVDVILQQQQEDGSWKERFPGVPDTCFALLFLKRANLAKDLTDKLRGVGAQPGVQQQPRTPGKKDQ